MLFFAILTIFSKKEQLFGFQKEQLLETFGNIFKSYKTIKNVSSRYMITKPSKIFNIL